METMLGSQWKIMVVKILSVRLIFSIEAKFNQVEKQKNNVYAKHCAWKQKERFLLPGAW